MARSGRTAETYEIRDAGLLKLFLGADIRDARGRADSRRTGRACSASRQLQSAFSPTRFPAATLLALEAGIGHEREYVRFWSALLEE